ncbi:DUF4870 domain-containing protein [Macrococcus sp. DPC7161]|uniref:DUF4870 domain-containing protein n=1 Tax=Macrococcus sp. DPC7161 TaxID=2507060 RepID=UPI00100A35C9|nr:DUF4870 domain-containing protein [Macrococcus sp. DPC7161]RXK17297.1 DUF4870 domain-containing protein [Macrococcus sp. DPC7161]
MDNYQNINETQFSNYQGNSPTSDEKTMAMLIYLTSFFTVIVGPLIIWIMKKDQSLFVDQIGKDYLNFFISYFIYSFIAGLLCIVFIGFIILPIIALMTFVFTIIAAVKAYNGERYLIPLTIQFVK